MAEIEFMTTGDDGTTLVDIDDLNNYLSTIFDEFNYTESPSDQQLIFESNPQCLKEMEPNTTASVSTNIRNAVPEKYKNEKYWSFRKKNNEATRRSREQNKKKLEKIFSNSEYLNKNFNALKEKHEILKKKYKRLVKRKKSMQTAISKIVEICNSDAMENVG